MPISRSFYFIRHGQTDWNLEGRLQGSKDIPLNNTGIEQARSAIPYIQKLDIDLIVSSPLSRAYETGKINADGAGIRIETCDDIRERYCGKSEGMIGREVIKQYRELSNDFSENISLANLPYDDEAETFEQVQARAARSINDILMRDNKKVLFSSHTGVFVALNVLLCGQYNNADNGVPYYFEKRADNTWAIEKVTL